MYFLNIIGQSSLIAFGMLFIRGLLSGIFFALPVGPLGTLCIQRTLTKGFGNGLASASGIVIADLIYVSVAAMGYSGLYLFIHQYFKVFSYIGLSIILMMGIKLLFDKKTPAFNPEIGASGTNMVKDFFSVFLVALLNPVGFLVFIAAFPVLQHNINFSHTVNLIILVGGIVFGIFLWWYIIIFTTSKFRNRIQADFLKNSRRILGGIITALVLVSFIILQFNKTI